MKRSVIIWHVVFRRPALTFEIKHADGQTKKKGFFPPKPPNFQNIRSAIENPDPLTPTNVLIREEIERDQRKER